MNLKPQDLLVLLGVAVWLVSPVLPAIVPMLAWAGLLVFELVNMLTPKLQHVIAGPRARWLAVALLGTLVVSTLTLVFAVVALVVAALVLAALVVLLVLVLSVLHISKLILS